jgi:uncharacterized repeat protein (TIGR02059 family)
MKNTIVIFLLILCSTANATTFYIDPSGSNSNSGSSSSPWKSLSYACSKVNTAGDIIHVNAGIYTETLPSILAPGVNIEGAGKTSVIRSGITTILQYTIVLSSVSEGTNGNQSISYIRMEGGLAAYGAILVERRKNVSIHHCEFEDFITRGIMYTGSGFGNDNVPAIYPTGNTFHDNIVTNCATYRGSGTSGSGLGNLEIGGQLGMQIYNNTIAQEDRGTGTTGFCIKYTSGGFCKGLKIYNNTISKPPYDGVTWDFSMELWNCRGGIEIYGNTIQGCIDFGGNTSITNDEGGYGFAVKIYNNFIGQSALRTREENGIDIERGQTGGFYIFNNIFKNLSGPLVMYQGNGDVFKDLYVYYNIFDNIGISGLTNFGSTINWASIDQDNITYDNINFVNNTINAGTGGDPMQGLRFDFRGNATNIRIRNNIIQGFKTCPLYMQTTSMISYVTVDNNLFYGNGNYNQPNFNSVTPSNFSSQNNIISNPLFISSSDFHLQAGSPAIGKGMAISWLTSDISGVSVKNPPSIGAYEFYLPGLPVYQNSVIENATPTLLDLNYDLILANVVPPVSAFNVLVNYASKSVSSVSILGNKVRLTLATPVVYGDIITVSYTAPAINPIQTALGGIAGSLATKNVTNNCVSNIPAYTSSVVENATPTVLDVSYSLNLANIIPVTSAFSIQVNSVPKAISSITITGNKVRITLASAVNYGDIISVSYIPPPSNPLQSTTGGLAAGLLNRSVTNNCTPIIPVCSSSTIENSTPSVIELTYSINLANIIPSVAAFNVQVNSGARSISSVSVTGTRVLLTLSNPVVYGNVVTVSYTKPSVSPLQSVSGGAAANLISKPVTNNCLQAGTGNNPPIVVVNIPKTIYAGFVSEIDATASYDPNNDPLTIDWVVPNNIPVSTLKGLKTYFLAPVSTSSKAVDFQLKVSDGTTLQSRIITIKILPYKPELLAAKIIHIEASGFHAPDSPANLVDGNNATNWSSDGDNQWVTLQLAEPCKISHLELAFLKGQQYESYFDIYGSIDNINWEPILTKATSCNFTGEKQVFDFPATKSNTAFSYVKYVGHGNSLNTWNKVSEFKVFGTGQSNANSFDKTKVTIYPNPTTDQLNISIGDTTFKPDRIRIADNSGAIVFVGKLNPEVRYIQTPINLKSGVYLVSLSAGDIMLYAQRLIVVR